MNHDKICGWLGLPAGHWPPDHYTLLGLTPGERDVARIEQHVHERLAKLRCYQLSHPEQVTEAMNRLAVAFMCLTDPQAKKTYDQQAGVNGDAGNKGQNGTSAHPPAAATSAAPAATTPATLDDTAVRAQTQVDWKNGPPPPVRAPAAVVDAPVDRPTPAAAPTATTDAAPSPAASTEAATPAAQAVAPVAQPADALYEAAYHSLEARRGIGTFHGLIERIYLTRQILWSWEQIGRHLHKSRRRIIRPGAQKDLARRLSEIGELMDNFPRILGQPGQPGYRVLAMARLEMATEMFNMLDPVQREALARDWIAGRVLLLGHRRFLRRELKSLRRQTWIGRGVRALRAAVNDHPGWVAVAVGAFIALAALFYALV